MNKIERVAKEARTLMLGQTFGVLSTISLDVAGYPFGSVTPYCLQRNGDPIILISDIAQHTKNIESDNRVSLTVLDHGQNDVQESARLTLVANAYKLDDNIEDSAEIYYNRFPESRGYHSAHDFSFYRLEAVSVRYIAGFGKINWIDPKNFILKNTFKKDEEDRIISHMTEDHQTAMGFILKAQKNINLGADQNIHMVGIDSEGFNMRIGKRIYRIPFEKNINTVQEAREILIKMSK